MEGLTTTRDAHADPRGGDRLASACGAHVRTVLRRSGPLVVFTRNLSSISVCNNLTEWGSWCKSARAVHVEQDPALALPQANAMRSA